MSLNLKVDKQAVLSLHSKTQSDLTQQVQVIREWLKFQAHLPTTKISDDFIERFIIGAKFSTEKAKERLDWYFSCRHYAHNLFTSDPLLDDDIQFTLQNEQIMMLDTYTSNYERIMIDRLRSANYVGYSLLGEMKLWLCYLDLLYRDDYNNGMVVVFDMKNCALEMQKEFNPVTIKKIADVILNGYGMRLGAMHFINAPKFISFLVNILRLVLKKKIFDRIHIHEHVDDLFKHVPKDAFPRDYFDNDDDARDHKSIEQITEECVAHLNDNIDFIKEQHSLKSNESLRDKSSTKMSDLCGLDGSFRTLHVD